MARPYRYTPEVGAATAVGVRQSITDTLKFAADPPASPPSAPPPPKAPKMANVTNWASNYYHMELAGCRHVRRVSPSPSPLRSHPSWRHCLYRVQTVRWRAPHQPPSHAPASRLLTSRSSRAPMISCMQTSTSSARGLAFSRHSASRRPTPARPPMTAHRSSRGCSEGLRDKIQIRCLGCADTARCCGPLCVIHSRMCGPDRVVSQ